MTSITQFYKGTLLAWINVFFLWYFLLFFPVADKVFGPATTTRHVYDVAAQHIVSGAMEGINGNAFAPSHTCV